MIHIGGPVCWVGDRIVQRCAWCGVALLEAYDVVGWPGDLGVGDLIELTDAGERLPFDAYDDWRPWFVPGDRTLPPGTCASGGVTPPE